MTSPKNRKSAAMPKTRYLLAMLLGTTQIAAAQTSSDPTPSTPAASAPVASNIVPLPELTVIETRTPVPLSQVGSSVTIITGEELRERQITQVIDALREVPGLSVNQNGQRSGPGQVRIRGGEGNHTLVLLDGVKMNDPNDNEFDITQLTTNEIERIEVLRGPQSMVYGADAAGGVISITTRRGEAGPPRVNASIEGGSFGTTNLRAGISGGGERYDYNLYGGRLASAGTVTAPGGRENDGYRNYTVGGRAGLRVNDNLRFEGSFRHTGSRGDTDGQDYVTGLAIDTLDNFRYRSTVGRGTAFLNLFDGRMENIFTVSGGSFERESRLASQLLSRTSTDRLRTEYQTNIRIIPNAVTTFGVDWQREGNRQLLYGSLQRFVAPDVQNTGVWAQQQIDLFDRLTLTGGVRHDENDFFGGATTYRFTGAYRIPSWGTKFRATYGTGFAPPSFSEMYFVPSASFVPNPNLRPERTRGWELGVDQEFLNRRILLGATYFNNRVKDFIAFNTGVFPFRLNNIGENEAQGVELTARLEPTRWASIVASYTLTDSNIVSSVTPSQNGLQLVRRPRNAASLNVTLRPVEAMRVNFGLVYNGTTQDSFFGAGGGRRTLSPYTLARIAVSYRVTPQVEVFGRVENAFDQRYQEVYGFQPPGIGGFGGVRVSF